jgi:uncharacterized protein YdaU (DUF1376 family)
MKNKSPAFQFYPKDYLSDINVQVMSLSERGAYMNLLCHEWLEGGLPDDDDILSILSGLGKEWFGKSGEKIRKCFTIKSEKFINPRLEKERKNQKERRKKRSDAGKKGNEARWNKGLKDIAKGSQCDNNAIAKDRSTTTSSSTTTTTPTKKKPLWILPEGIKPEVWQEFEAHRKTTKVKLTDDARTKNANILLKNLGDQQEIIDSTIANGWTGLFPLKKGKGGVNSGKHTGLNEKDYSEGIGADGSF